MSTTTTTTTASAGASSVASDASNGPTSSSAPSQNTEGLGATTSSTSAITFPAESSPTGLANSTSSSPNEPTSTTQGSKISTETHITYHTTFTQPYTAAAGQVLTGETTVSLPVRFVSKGLSSGATGGVAIATAIIGAAIAALAVMFISKRKHQKFRKTTSKYSDKPSSNIATVPTQSAEPDDDRFLPQPLDDASMKRTVQNLFSQIDGHVESFYDNSKASSQAVHVNGIQSSQEFFSNPVTRLFMIKRLICSTMLESIHPNCRPEMSFLPHGFAMLSQQLREPNLDERATTLSWSRLRTSFSFLFKPEGGSGLAYLDQAIPLVRNNLDQSIQQFELAGTTSRRLQDLDAICRESATLGQVLLSQPAVWEFDWLRGGRGPPVSQGSRQRLTYFPALARLTDNKARKLASAQLVIQAKTMQ